MIYKDYFLKKNITQEIFNKKLNWYFDIKSILYQKKNFFNEETVLHAKILKKDYLKLNITKNINNHKRQKQSQITKKINWKKFIKSGDKEYKLKFQNLFLYLLKNDIKSYFKHFIVHGSISSNDYIKGWSDLDTFVVLKDEILSDEKKVIKLRKILKNFYKRLIKISLFQHHGLIIYTEKDLRNYLKGFLPIQALEKNFNLLSNEKIVINSIKQKKNLSLNSLKDRLNYLKDANLTGFYKHHSFKGRNLKTPLKAGRNELYQLFCHIGYILNIPILYFDSTGRSVHKKKSFVKFYDEIKDYEIISIIKKSEKIRKIWANKKIKNNEIPKWIIDIIGEHYMADSLKAIKKIIILINKFYKK